MDRAGPKGLRRGIEVKPVLDFDADGGIGQWAYGAEKGFGAAIEFLVLEGGADLIVVGGIYFLMGIVAVAAIDVQRLEQLIAQIQG